MSHAVRNVTNRALSITGGRVLEPGEDAEVEPNDHDRALEDEGKLLRLPPHMQPNAKKKES